VCRMKAGQSGKIVEVQGGHGLVNRLDALGVRLGKKVTKVSSMLMRGPATIQVGNTQVAIGFGMAGKIIVQLD
ncbi:ferrous iron transport protein A, partial [Chloroflexota bacterium]